jgi:hypothetical protein
MEKTFLSDFEDEICYFSRATSRTGFDEGAKVGSRGIKLETITNAQYDGCSSYNATRDFQPRCDSLDPSVHSLRKRGLFFVLILNIGDNMSTCMMYDSFKKK